MLIQIAVVAGAVYVHCLEIEANWSRLVIMTVTLSTVTFATVTLVTVSIAQTVLQGSDSVSAVATTEVEKQCYDHVQFERSTHIVAQQYAADVSDSRPVATVSHTCYC
jgi:hypothetical protein